MSSQANSSWRFSERTSGGSHKLQQRKTLILHKENNLTEVAGKRSDRLPRVPVASPLTVVIKTFWKTPEQRDLTLRLALHKAGVLNR